MELSNSLELVVRDFGHSILSSPRLINILNDYNAFKNNIAAKLIMQTAISSNHIERFLKIGKYDTHAQLLIDKFSYEFGFKHENVQTVFRAIAIALNWDVKAFESTVSVANSFKEESLMDETLSLLKEGAIFCKKDNQIILLTLDGKKSIPSIIPYDYQSIKKDGIIINKSSVFGYEPYDLFYSFECAGGLVQPKYRDHLAPSEWNDWNSYHEEYGYNNQGMISFDGKILIPFEYSSLYKIKNKNVFYAVVSSGDERYARIVNAKGKIILDKLKMGWNPWNDNLKNGIIENEIDDVRTYFNTKGEKVFQNYDYINCTEDGKLIKVSKNRKEGIADSKGNLIISPIFDFCIIHERCGLIMARLGNKYGLFDVAGTCITGFEYDDIHIFQEHSIIIVKKDKVYGALNMQGKEIIACEFEELFINTGGCNFVQKDSISGKYGVFNHEFSSGPYDEGSMVIPYIFTSHKIYNAVIAKKDGKYGMYAFNGRKIVDCIYNELTTCVNGTSYFKDNNGQGIISCHDKELFRTSFKYAFIQAYANHNRHIAVLRGLNGNDKWGLLDARGNEATEFIYDRLEHISFGLTKASVKVKTGSYYNDYYLHGLINSYGDVILPIEYKKITCISEKLFKIEVSYNKYFCCNENGERIIDEFNNLAVIGNLVVISRENGRYQKDGYTTTKYCYQFFDKKGNLVNSNVYDEIGDEYSREFIMGLLKVSKNGKIGFINELGAETIPCIYDDARTPIKVK